MRVARGLEPLPDRERRELIDFFCSRQRPDGGFCGRGDSSDLYYSAFALRGLAVLGSESRDAVRKAACYLRTQLNRRVGVVDLVSLVFASSLIEMSLGTHPLDEVKLPWRRSVAETLEQLRRSDGGYAKSTEGGASSTYHTFLVLLVYELLELPLPDGDKIGDFLLGQQRDDGGFVEIRPMKRSGTNPTAAAVGALRILAQNSAGDLLTDDLSGRVVAFLLDRVTDEGGLRANTQIPIADLLSTFTGLHTLVDLGALEQVDQPAVRQYVDSLRHPEGGFRAATWDTIADVEYTFYGTGTLGLLVDE